jgi:hypothetical protein
MLHGTLSGFSRLVPVVGSCELGSEPLASIKVGEFLDQLSFSRLTLLRGVSEDRGSNQRMEIIAS